MSLNELIELQAKLEPCLLLDDYSFIGPENQNLLNQFTNRVNDFAPIVSFNRELRHFLGNKEAVLAALPYLPHGTELRIYVINGKVDNVLLHDTIESYCKRNNINLL
jgi:hypothetical protein